MRKYLLAMLTSAAVVSCAGLPAAAQEDQGGVVIVQAPHHPQEEMPGQSGSPERGGMMGSGKMMERMMGRGRDAATSSHVPPMHPIAMYIIFALMDADGDGTISLQEFQAAHERLFKAMDRNKDGQLSLDEMQSFMHGSIGAQQAR
jgi:hypothetical protein